MAKTEKIVFTGEQMVTIEQTSFLCGFMIGRGEQGATEGEMEDAWNKYLADRSKILRGMRP